MTHNFFRPPLPLHSETLSHWPSQAELLTPPLYSSWRVYYDACRARVSAAVHAGTLADAAMMEPPSLGVGDRSSLFLCLFCSRNANLCDPYYACYPGTAAAGGGPQRAATALVAAAVSAAE